MDPYYEQRLRDEVIYLHSLWHQGPPSRSFPYSNLPPLNPTHFKKQHNRTPKFNPRQPKKVGKFSGTEWPVKPHPAPPPLTQSGWPELKLKSKPQQTTRLPTPEEVEKYNWNQVQQKALEAAKEFFAKNGEDSDEEDDDDDDMDEDRDDVEDHEYAFLWKMFDEDEELKGYYVKHCAGGGEFSCLVCGVANEKYRKRFKECIALVQHSISIAKTKKLRSHRAYGQVICKILGWDIDRLPSSIVADHKSGDLHGNDVNADKEDKDDKDTVSAPKTPAPAPVSKGKERVGDASGRKCFKCQSYGHFRADCPNPRVERKVKDANGASLNTVMDNGESNLEVDDPNEKAHDVSETVDGESMVCEDSSLTANVEEENREKQVLNGEEGSAGGAVNNLCRNLSSTMVLAPAPEPAPAPAPME